MDIKTLTIAGNKISLCYANPKKTRLDLTWNNRRIGFYFDVTEARKAFYTITRILSK